MRKGAGGGWCVEPSPIILSCYCQCTIGLMPVPLICWYAACFRIIYGFASREHCSKVLRDQSDGTFLLRFSESFLSGNHMNSKGALAYVLKEGDGMNMSFQAILLRCWFMPGFECVGSPCLLVPCSPLKQWCSVNPCISHAVHELYDSQGVRTWSMYCHPAE